MLLEAVGCTGTIARHAEGGSAGGDGGWPGFSLAPSSASTAFLARAFGVAFAFPFAFAFAVACAFPFASGFAWTFCVLLLGSSSSSSSSSSGLSLRFALLQLSLIFTHKGGHVVLCCIVSGFPQAQTL